MLAFGGAYAVGAGTDPIAEPRPSPPGPGDGRHGRDDPGADGTSRPHGATPRTATARGARPSCDELPVSAVNGYTLEPVATTCQPGRSRRSGSGSPARTASPSRRTTWTHEKDLHLIVVRRDLAGFQHVHPMRAADGTWSVPLDLRRAGTWRVFADFKPAGAEERADARHRPHRGRVVRPGPVAAGTDHVDDIDGYDVTLAGKPEAGQDVGADLHGPRERQAGDRSAALPRRLRAPGLAAQPATWPTCTSTPRRRRTPVTPAGRSASSAPSSRPPAATGCSSTSSTAARCTPRSSPWSCGRPTHRHHRRATVTATDRRRMPTEQRPSSCHRRHDVRVVRRAGREEAEPDGRRHRHGQLRHREGQGDLRRTVSPRTT